MDRFLAAGAALIFVGPNTGLRGPPGRVEPLVQHDNHLHVRLPARRTTAVKELDPPWWGGLSLSVYTVH